MPHSGTPQLGSDILGEEDSQKKSNNKAALKRYVLQNCKFDKNG